MWGLVRKGSKKKEAFDPSREAWVGFQVVEHGREGAVGTEAGRQVIREAT